VTKKTEIEQLKLLAKRFAHAMRSNHRDALDAIAAKLGFPHWKALTVKAGKGWMPSEDELAKVDAFVREYSPSLGGRPKFIEQSMLRPVGEPIQVGEIDGHAYRVTEFSGDIRMEGEGWRILIGEADFSQPVVEIETAHKELCPANDPSFVEKALEVAESQVVKARAGIASDWPRRSTKPNSKGEVVHPLHGDEAAEWFCLHCNGKMTGSQIAENLWHCPSCGASPLDIFTAPWWLEGSDERPTVIEYAEDRQRPEQKVEVVDSRPTLRLDEQSIPLLLRIALLEDAKTPGERLGALLAEINVDDENDAWITFDEDLWPEDKHAGAAIAVADKLGVELELAMTCMTFPFAWPGLGHFTTSTSEYVQMMLDAYEEHGVVLREKGDEQTE
jgi:ribosomal protein L37AE/L43A